MSRMFINAFIALLVCLIAISMGKEITILLFYVVYIAGLLTDVVYNKDKWRF